MGLACRLIYADTFTSLFRMPPQTPLKPDVPAEIRAEIARRGWSKREFAARAGLKEVTAYRILQSKTKLNVPQLLAIASAFDLTPSELMARAEDAA